MDPTKIDYNQILVRVLWIKSRLEGLLCSALLAYLATKFLSLLFGSITHYINGFEVARGVNCWLLAAVF